MRSLERRERCLTVVASKCRHGLFSARHVDYMARRRQSNSDSLLELSAKIVLLFLGLIVFAIGPTRRQAIITQGTNILLLVLGIVALAFLGWLLFKILLPFLERRPEPEIRVLNYPPESVPSIQDVVAPYEPKEPDQVATPCAVDQPELNSHEPETTMTGDITEQLRAIDWFQFEKIVALIYRKLGNEVERRGGAKPDGGIDLLLRRDGATLGVQCKHWKTWKVGVKAVREFLGALTAAGLRDGVFVSLGEFTTDAAGFANQHGIRLVGPRDLANMMEQNGMRGDPEFLAALADTRKYCPKCERELVLRTAKKGANAGQQFWGCCAYPKCNYILRT